MSKADHASAFSEPLPVPALSPLAGILSYLIPGLGQIVQGRVAKGVFFLVILLSMFHVGQALGGWKNVYMPIVEMEGREQFGRSYNPLQSIYQRWPFAGQVFIGMAAWPAILQFYDVSLPTDDPFLKRFQGEPMPQDKFLRAELRRGGAADHRAQSPEGALNQEIVAGTRHWDVGLVYTIVAGVLNILVIYDAVAGPAFGARRVVSPEQPQPGEVPS